MPINVKMPDGTIVQNVPDNVTQTQLTSLYDAYSKKTGSTSPSQPWTATAREIPVKAFGQFADMFGNAPNRVANLAKAGYGVVTGHPQEMTPDPDYVQNAMNRTGAWEGIPGGIMNKDPMTPAQQTVSRYGQAALLGATGGGPAGLARGAALGLAGQGAVDAAAKIAPDSPLAQTAAGTLIPALLGRGGIETLRDPGGVKAAAARAAKTADRPGRMTATEANTLRNARKMGFVVAPSDVGTRSVGSLLQGVGGKAAVQQMADLRNAKVLSGAVKQTLGIPGHQDVTPATLEAARAPFRQVYQTISQLPVTFKATNAYLTRIQSLGRELQAAAKLHPNIVNIDKIKLIQHDLSHPQMAPSTAMTLIRQLRSDASVTLDRAFNQEKPSAEQIALGKAQRGAADAIEKMVQANLRASGNGALYQSFKNARRYLAVSHDIESSLNPATGHIDPQKLRRIEEQAGNRRFSGPLKDAVRFAQAFPKSMKSPEKSGNVTPYGFWQTLGAAGAAAAHQPLLSAAMLSQPALRHAALSRPVQAALLRGQP